MNRISWLTICILLACLSGLQAQVAATNGNGVISVNGSAELTKNPEVLRIYFKQYGKGADQDAAKGALVAAEKKLQTKLEAMGAEVIVTHAGLPSTSQNLLNRHRNITSIMMQRQMQQGGVVASSVDKTTFLERFLTIDLRSKAKNKDIPNLLSELQERLRKDYLDLSGITDSLPKEEENNNNNNGNRFEYSSYRNDTSQYTNDVRFQLAAKITREDRIKLYSEAMKRARTVAQDLAEAAEMKVGSLQTLSSGFNANYNISNSSNYPRGFNGIGEVAKFPLTLKEDGTESIAVRDVNVGSYNSGPEPINFAISLSATFKLEAAK